MAALKLSEVEQTLTGSTQMKRILFDCCSLVSYSYPEEPRITIGRSNVCNGKCLLVHMSMSLGKLLCG